MVRFFCTACALVALLCAADPALARERRVVGDDPGVSAGLRSPPAERGPDSPDWTRIDRYRGSTTVITRQMLDDYKAQTLCDALRLAPGVFVGGC